MARISTRKKKKAFTLVVVAVVAAAIAGVAVAYYAGTGASAPASATLGHSPLAVTVTVDPLATTLYPGDSESITTHISAGTHRAYVGSVSFAVGSLPSGCLASWFTAPTVSVGTVVPANGSITATGTLTFTDQSLDQSACSDGSPSVTATAQPTP